MVIQSLNRQVSLDLSHFEIKVETELTEIVSQWCALRVIKRPTLAQFWESRKEDSRQAEQDLTAWYKIAKKAAWKDFGALKQTFGSADQVGNCVVFDVGNNRYRLIGQVKYGSINPKMGILFVRKVMDHKEYDKKLWVKQCGCLAQPRQSKAKPRKITPKGRDKQG